jgi:Chromo (CHRromatin Organisation MOdifier) domain
MQERTARHKEVFDRHVRKRADIDIGDTVFVRTYVTEPARSPKLQFPVTGPYPLVRCFETGIEILTADGRQRLHWDRVIRAPSAKNLPPGVEWVPVVPRRRTTPEPSLEETEYVIERLLDHGQDEDGRTILKVRWAGFKPADDTWEPIQNLPEELVRRYAKRRKIELPSSLSQVSPAR